MAGTFKSLTHCDVCLISPVLKEGRNNYHQITHLSWTVGFWQYHETEINMWNCSCIASKNNITKESISKNCTCTVKKMITSPVPVHWFVFMSCFYVTWLSPYLCTALFIFCLEFPQWEPVHGQQVHVDLALVDPQGRCIWGEEVLTSVVIVSVHGQQARVDLALVDPQGRCIWGFLEVLTSVDIVFFCSTYTPDGPVYTHNLVETQRESICAVNFPYRHLASTGD